MNISGSFNLSVVMDGQNAVDYKVTCNLAAIKMDANNVQSQAAVFSFIKIDGSTETPLSAYPRLLIHDSEGSFLLDSKIAAKSSSYTYSIPQKLYGTAASLKVSMYSDSGHTSELASRTLPIVRETPLPIPRGSWSVSDIFNNGNYLLIDGMVYMWINPIAGNSLVAPATDIANNPSTTSWKAYEEWKLLCTQLLIARLGLIGDAVFYDQYMFSKSGVDSSGNASTDYQDFAAGTFTPNILFNFLTGAGHYCAGNIKFDEYGRTFRKSKDIIVWRYLYNEIPQGATEYNLNLKKGTYFYPWGTGAYCNLPDPALHQGLELEFKGPIATTRTYVPIAIIRCLFSQMIGYNTSSEESVDCNSVQTSVSGSLRATITSSLINEQWRWVADHNFNIIS